MTQLLGIERRETEEIERFRPLLPVGYSSVAAAYAEAAAQISARDLTNHYTTGVAWFHDEFVPQLKARMSWLTGGEWSATDLSDFVAFAAGRAACLLALQDVRVRLPPGALAQDVGKPGNPPVSGTRKRGSQSLRSYLCRCGSIQKGSAP